MYSVSSKKIIAMIFAGLKNKAEMARMIKATVMGTSYCCEGWKKVRREALYNLDIVFSSAWFVGEVGYV